MKIRVFVTFLLSVLFTLTASAAFVTKVVITVPEPVVGEARTFKARVPETASTEIYEVHWSGEFENGKFVQGNDYTISVLLRIKSSSPNKFSTSGVINATINGQKARVTSTKDRTATVKYTWKTLGGENPNNPKTKLRTKLAGIAAAYTATNATNDKEVMEYLRSVLPDADIWYTGVSYRYTRKMATETDDGRITVPIGIKYGDVTLDTYNFSVVLPALNKSPEDAMLKADMALMKEALRVFPVTAKTKANDLLSAMNAAAVNGTKAVWNKNYTYTAPTSTNQGSIEGEVLLTLGSRKDVFRAHTTLPIDGDDFDAAIDADFGALSDALHSCSVNNKTTEQELMAVANSAIKNGSKLTLVSFTKNRAAYESEGKIVMNFTLENKGKSRAPRIAMRIAKLRPELPQGISVNQDEWEVLRLTNIERFKRGLTSLAMIAPLQDAGDIRAKEVYVDLRLDHLRPDGSPCHTAVDPKFAKYRGIAENCQRNAPTPSEAMASWMRSSGHKANILTPTHSYIGTGMYAKGSLKHWVQIFADGKDINSAETSTGSTHFETIDDMKEAYLILYTTSGHNAYVPLDDAYMVKHGNSYTMHLASISVTVTVGTDEN